jgi:FAD/FMN-containing dehydrogenase
VCSIDGNVAEKSGGAHCFKYGLTTHYVTGLEVVLPDGEVVQLGGASRPVPIRPRVPAAMPQRRRAGRRLARRGTSSAAGRGAARRLRALWLCLPTCLTYALWGEEMDFPARSHPAHAARP